MLQNYIKTAWRSLARNKSYSFINIGGLAIALTVFLLIMLFVRHELSYNSFFTDSDRIYRILFADENSGNIGTQLPEPIAGELWKLFPEVEEAVSIHNNQDALLKSEDNELYTSGLVQADDNFFNLFYCSFLAGHPDEALTEPNSSVITESLAKRLFGAADSAMGRTFLVDNNREFQVKGVIKDLPANTHFDIKAIIPRKALPYDLWTMRGPEGYIKLTSSEQAKQLQTKLPGYADEYGNFPEGAINNARLIIQPLTDVHLYPHSREAESSRLIYIQILLFVAGLILLMSCINYINLATARSALRGHEIGIRKTAGAKRTQIMAQLLLESVLTCTLAFAASVCLVELLNPIVHQYFDVALSSLFSFSWEWIALLMGTLLVVGIISGSYAAIYLSSFQPSDALKGSGPQSKKKSDKLRKTLVIVQFSIAITIVIASILITGQMDYIRTERLNGHDDQVLVIQNSSREIQEKFSAFKQELLLNSNISSVTAGTLPNQIGMRAFFEDTEGEGSPLHYFSVEYDYLETMGLKLVSGRDFDDQHSQGTTESVILNETAARAFGFEEANGQAIDAAPQGSLIGIVEDFHAHTLYDPIEPVALRHIKRFRSRMTTIMIRFREGGIASGIEHVQDVWSQFEPAYPLNYSFLDTIMDQDYQAEIRLAKIFNVFSGFSILIACLGLFGLAAFSAQQRTKEIGIRKVNGASVASIVALLSKDFMKLVLISILIAIPIAWYAMNRWLEDFAYRIEIGPGVFILAGLIAIIIALATVSWQAVKAGLMNPVNSLRNE